MRVAPIIAATAFALATPVLEAEPRGLSLQEAQTLPEQALTERVLGAVGAPYTEIARPSPTIRWGRAFEITFATSPRPVGLPGLCEAETVSVSFGPAANSPITTIAHVQFVRRRKVYRIVGDTAPSPDKWTEDYRRMIAAQCAAAGPVLSGPGVTSRHFFGGSDSGDGDLGASQAYFGARALAKALQAATAGTLSVECREDYGNPSDPVCGAPNLLPNLSMDRFVGFEINRCPPEPAELCVTANFARGGNYASYIAVRIRTSLAEIVGQVPEFTVREVSVRTYAIMP